MKIIDVLNFYFAHYPVISVRIRIDGGLFGIYHDFSEAEAHDFVEGYGDCEVIHTEFGTHTLYMGNSSEKREIPYLYIVYKFN